MITQEYKEHLAFSFNVKVKCYATFVLLPIEMDWAEFGKQLFGFSSTSFDIISDIINSLTFLGYYNSPDINDELIPLNLSVNHGNLSQWTNSSEAATNLTPTEERVDMIWGILSLIIIFLPGIIGFIPATIMAIHQKEWVAAIGTFILSFTFPAFLLIFQFHYTTIIFLN